MIRTAAWTVFPGVRAGARRSVSLRALVVLTMVTMLARAILVLLVVGLVAGFVFGVLQHAVGLPAPGAAVGAVIGVAVVPVLRWARRRHDRHGAQ